MKLSYLCTMLDDIAAVSGKNDKVMLLKKYLQEETFRTLIKYMLDPYITFGVRDFSDYTLELQDATFAELEELLNKLANRELTGGAASHQTGVMAVRGVGRDLMLRILNKDPKAGFGISSVNKARPGLLPEFPYQRCSLPKDSKIDEFNWKVGVISQLKADGSFVNINKKSSNDITLMSRQGTLIPLDEFGPLVSDIQAYIESGTQTHGELLVTRNGEVLPREIGNGILNSVVQGGKLGAGEMFICQVWDQIPLTEVKPKAKYKTPYGLRFETLKFLLAGASVLKPIPTRYVYSRKEAYQHYQEMLEKGFEGTILKDLDAPWIDGTSKFCVKLKLEADCDLVVTGFRPGKGKNEATFGAIIAHTSDGNLEVGVSGFTDAQRKQLWKDKDKVIGSIMTVKANMVMKPSASNNVHSLFLPRFVELRQDKTEADTLEQVINQFEAAKQGVA